MKFDNERLVAVNAALATFTSGTTVVKGDRGWLVQWADHNGKEHSYRWQLQPGSCSFPAWSHRWPHGGTACNALCQLMFWLQGKDVMPLGTWQYWASDLIKLGNVQTIEILKAAGWPQVVQCIKCKKAISPGDMDWYRIGKKAGPGHRHSSIYCQGEG